MLADCDFVVDVFVCDFSVIEFELTSLTQLVSGNAHQVTCFRWLRVQPRNRDGIVVQHRRTINVGLFRWLKVRACNTTQKCDYSLGFCTNSNKYMEEYGRSELTISSCTELELRPNLKWTGLRFSGTASYCSGGWSGALPDIRAFSAINCSSGQRLLVIVSRLNSFNSLEL